MGVGLEYGGCSEIWSLFLNMEVALKCEGFLEERVYTLCHSLI